MATITDLVSTEKQHSQREKLWSLVETGALKALTKVRFSTEDKELYPPLCKQHIWQQALTQAVTQAAKLLKDFPSLKLMHGLLPYTPMDPFTFHMDAAYKSTQFGKEELSFLRKLRLEQFLCNVPWGVVHQEQAIEAINTLQEKTLKVTLKGETLPFFSEDWRKLMLNVFKLSPKEESEGEALQLHELFPSLKTIQKGQVTVKVSDCQLPGSKRPLRLLSSFFCLNTSSQYSVTIHFAKLILAAVNGQKVDWPLEFFDEFKAEVITLHRHQKQDKAKVLKTAIGPHLTLIIDEADLLTKEERRVAGFGTPSGFTMIERAPPPRKRKLGDPSGTGKLDAVIRVVQRFPHPSKKQSQAAREAEAEEAPPKRQVIQAAEKWQVPDSTSNMLNQICFTHRRLEQLLTTFTSKAGPEFVKKMDDEFQKLQVEATRHYQQGLRLKEPLTTNEQEIEKGLLHIEVQTLTKQLATLTEDYEGQIEMSFELQEQISTLEAQIVSLAEAKQDQNAQMLAGQAEAQQALESTRSELKASQQQLVALQNQHQEQANVLAATKEELRQFTTPDTPRSEDRTPRASGSTAQVHTSGLHSMVEEAPHPKEAQQQTITDLQQELAYVSRERDELQVNLERIVESPRNFEEENLGPSDIPRTHTMPKTAIYHQLTTNIPPMTSIMQYYHALKGVNLLISRVPLIKTGTVLSKAQFEQIWQVADATARDTLTFMWVTGDIKLPTGVIEVVTGSPPFYVGRFVLRTLTFISHHHASYYNHTPAHRLPNLKPYPKPMFNQIRELVKNQPITFNQALATLTTEDTTICYEAVKQYTWLQERHPHRIPGPYTIQQIKEYVMRVIREKEMAISTRRFGTPSQRTILQADLYSQERA